MEIAQDEELCPKFFYFDHIKNVPNDDTICGICNIQEKDICWTRYEIACGNKFHTRCFRNYIAKKGCLYCKICDKNIGMTDKTESCQRCYEFGHNDSHCKKKIVNEVNYSIYKMTSTY
jgi:hypothetical protein